MAIDPKDLSAFANRKTGGKPVVEDEVELPEDEMGDEEMPEDEPESEEEGAADDALEQEYPKLFPALEEYGKEFEAVADELDPDILINPEADITENPEELELLFAGLDELPEDLQDALGEEVPMMDWEKAMAIAEALVVGKHVKDSDKVAGLLFHIGQLFDESGLEEGEEGDEEMPEGEGEEMPEDEGEEMPEEA